MPNHCSNKLIVKGTKDDVTDFWGALLGDDGEYHINNLIPMPQGLKGSDGWWNWANENWGTKWGAYEEFFSVNEPGHLEIQYDTAWNPFSVEFWENIAERFPNLTFIIVYHETMLDFAGGHRVRHDYPTIDIEEGCLSDHYPSEDGIGNPDDVWEVQTEAVAKYIDNLIQELASL